MIKDLKSLQSEFSLNLNSKDSNAHHGLKKLM